MNTREPLSPDEPILASLPGDPASIAGARRLLNDALGAGTYRDEDVAALVRDPGYLLVAAHLGDLLVGVAGAKILAPGAEPSLAAFGASNEQLGASRRLGCLDTAAVVSGYRGRGIGMRLAAARISWLRAGGVEVAYAISWMSGQAHTSARVLERLHFTRAGIAHEHFLEMSIRTGYRCPTCGFPCRCAAVLYVKDLTAS